MDKWIMVFFNSKKKIIYTHENIEEYIICNVDENVLLGDKEYCVIKKVYDYLNKTIRIHLEEV